MPADLLDVFDGIDFSDDRVRLVILAIGGATAVFSVLLTVVFRLVLPTSKTGDPEALGFAIRRLERIMRVEETALFVSGTVFVALGLGHLLGVIDITVSPLSWVALADVCVIPVLIVAVYGPGGGTTSANMLKLRQLRRMRRKATALRPAEPWVGTDHDGPPGDHREG